MFFREETLSFRIKTDRKQQLYLMELKKNMMRDDSKMYFVILRGRPIISHWRICEKVQKSLLNFTSLLSIFE